MATQRFQIERLGRHHDRAAFASGEPSLDRYLQQTARQDAERNVSTVFVLNDARSARVAGYYSLSASLVALRHLPSEMAKRLPRYADVPVILLGRLAVDRDYQGQGFGELLLLDALSRAANIGETEVGATAVVVDALHDRAITFYEQYGFRLLPEQRIKLILSIREIRQLLAE